MNISIDDPATPDNPDKTGSAVTGTSDWNSSENYFSLDLRNIYDIKAGFFVSVSDGEKTKEHTVTNLVVLSVDPVEETISGTADPNVPLRVDVHNTNGVGMDVESDSYGNWTADFTGQYNLKPGDWGRVQEYDSDRDSTGDDWSIPNPKFGVRANWDKVEGWQWPLGATVEVAIDDPVTSEDPDATWSGTAAACDYDPNQACLNIGFGGQYDIKAGDLVTVTDGATTKEHVVVNFEITDIDLDTDTVYGIAEPNQTVSVWTCWQNEPCINREVVADQDGNWSENFGIPGDQYWEQETSDLRPGIWVDSAVWDEDGDGTMFGWRVLNPYVEASPTGNWVHAREWPIGTVITMTINGSDGSYTATATMGPAPWNPGDPNDIVADFDLQGYDVQPGDIITTTGNDTSKTLIVADLRMTSYDIDADTISGVATPGAQVEICVNFPDHCASRYVTADAITGAWTADYAHPGAQSNEQEIVDLQPGSNGWTAEYEADSDRTWADWQIIWPPTCQAGNSISGTVYFGDGATPIQDATVIFENYHIGDQLLQARTDGNGNYSCYLPAGIYRIWAFSSSQSREYYEETIYENAAQVVVSEDSQQPGVNFTLDTPSVTYDHLTFNMTDPVAGELAVRQAIAYGTDRARVIAATYPYSPLWDTYLPPDHWAHATSGVPQYDFDPQLARDILTAAGWVDEDGDGVREKNGVRLHIDYYTTWATLRATVSQIFVENMADIGIEVEVFALSPGILFASDGPLFGTHEFGIAQFAWGVDVNDDTLFHGEIFESQSENNVGLYNNPAADGLLAEARALGTRAEKLLYLQQHQALVMTDLATLPLFQRIESPPPVADAGPDQTVGEGTVVTLSGGNQ
ncbi:MAG: ABC transporter substrate-binding protein, partial [Chloroflexota bacterium]